MKGEPKNRRLSNPSYARKNVSGTILKLYPTNVCESSLMADSYLHVAVPYPTQLRISVCVSVCLPVSLCVGICLSLSVWVSVCLTVCFSLSGYLSVSLSH